MSGAEQEWSWPGVAADSDRGGEPGSGVLGEVVLAVLGLGCLRAARWVVGLVRVQGSVWSPE